MRNMSFFLTQEQILSCSKTVTRRNGWKFLKSGDEIQPIVMGQGLKKGEKVQKIGSPIKVLSVRTESLDAIDQKDVVREGFPDMTPDDFIEMYMKANKCSRDHPVQRIEFVYIPDDLPF